MNTKQIVVIVIVVVLMGGLLARPIKGLVDQNTGANDTADAGTSSDRVRHYQAVYKC